MSFAECVSDLAKAAEVIKEHKFRRDGAHTNAVLKTDRITDLIEDPEDEVLAVLKGREIAVHASLDEEDVSDMSLEKTIAALRELSRVYAIAGLGEKIEFVEIRAEQLKRDIELKKQQLGESRMTPGQVEAQIAQVRREVALLRDSLG